MTQTKTMAEELHSPITFKDVIGWDFLKDKLRRIISYADRKDKLGDGLDLPRGIILYGAPGKGKTFLAMAFVNETRRTAYLLHHDMAKEAFIQKMRDTFAEAKKHQPSVILLDDMDKFRSDKDSQEESYVLQSLIDDIARDDILYIATANSLRALTPSLLRQGRFDYTFPLGTPSEEDSKKLLQYYTRKMCFSSEINFDDIVAMMSFDSPAEVQSYLKEVRIIAFENQHEKITADDFIKGYLRDATSEEKTSQDEYLEKAYHEAGHIVVHEALLPHSVGFSCIISDWDSAGGVTKSRITLRRRPQIILTDLAGKVAVELNLPKIASGCASDNAHAAYDLSAGLTDSMTHGAAFLKDENHLGMFLDGAKTALLENYLTIDRMILLENKALLEAIAERLFKQKYILFHEIQDLEKQYPLQRTHALGV